MSIALVMPSNHLILCREINKEDLYTLKVNCKGKSTVGKANKRINVEKNYNRFKKIKIKKREKKKKENFTELQNSNVEAEVYNNNKNVTEKIN